MTGILKPDGFGSRALPSHPLSGRHCTWTPVTPAQAPTQGSVTRHQSVPAAPNGPCWWLLHQCDPLSIPLSRTVPLLGKEFHQTLLAPGPGSEWMNSEGLGAHLALPKVSRQPLPHGLNHLPAGPLCSLLESGNHFSHNTLLGVSIGKRPSMDWTARDLTTQSADSRMATSVLWATANHIPSYRGATVQHQLW
jgi:hypothetical protein